jgi:hypothetical protein
VVVRPQGNARAVNILLALFTLGTLVTVAAFLR